MEGERDGIVAVSIEQMRPLSVDPNMLYRTTRSDWLAWETAREPIERAYFVPS